MEKEKRGERSDFWREERAQFPRDSDCTVPKTDYTTKFPTARERRFQDREWAHFSRQTEGLFLQKSVPVHI